MIANLIRRPDGFFEVETEMDTNKLAKLQPGEILEVKWRKVRDPLNHARFFVMIQIGFDNQEFYKDPDIYRYAKEMEAGYFNEVELKFKDETFKRRWPASIDYATLDETKFTEIKKRVGDVIAADLGMTEPELQEEVIKLAYINPT